jgi:hypothetical protein
VWHYPPADKKVAATDEGLRANFSGAAIVTSGAVWAHPGPTAVKVKENPGRANLRGFFTYRTYGLALSDIQKNKMGSSPKASDACAAVFGQKNFTRNAAVRQRSLVGSRGNSGWWLA